MSMTRDSDNRALDINIGRVLEMFRTGFLPRQAAHEALAKFFSDCGRHKDAQLDADLDRVLARVDDNSLALKQARENLVKAAVACERNDPKAAEMLHRIAEPA